MTAYDEFEQYLEQLGRAAYAQLHGAPPAEKRAFVPSPGMAQVLQAQQPAAGDPQAAAAAGGVPAVAAAAAPGAAPADPQAAQATQAAPAPAADPAAPPAEQQSLPLTADDVRNIIRQELQTGQGGGASGGGGAKGGKGKGGGGDEVLRNIAVDAFHAKQIATQVAQALGIPVQLTDPHRDPHTGLPTQAGGDQAAQAPTQGAPAPAAQAQPADAGAVGGVPPLPQVPAVPSPKQAGDLGDILDFVRSVQGASVGLPSPDAIRVTQWMPGQDLHDPAKAAFELPPLAGRAMTDEEWGHPVDAPVAEATPESADLARTLAMLWGR